MTSSNNHEPTNEQLWAQPPALGDLDPTRQTAIQPVTPVAPATVRADKTQFNLAIVSLALGVPLSAIAAGTVTPSVVGLIVTWVGIVLVNLIYGKHRRG